VTGCHVEEFRRGEAVNVSGSASVSVSGMCGAEKHMKVLDICLVRVRGERGSRVVDAFGCLMSVGREGG
jgi:hypothetical protein